MRDLSDLEARLVRWEGPGSMREGVRKVADADGLVFLCPGCFEQNGGAEGTHSILIWFAGCKAPPEARPDPRWRASGLMVGDLTLEPSIASGCWHGWVKNGRAG